MRNTLSIIAALFFFSCLASYDTIEGNGKGGNEPKDCAEKIDSLYKEIKARDFIISDLEKDIDSLSIKNDELEFTLRNAFKKIGFSDTVHLMKNRIQEPALGSMNE